MIPRWNKQGLKTIGSPLIAFLFLTCEEPNVEPQGPALSTNTYPAVEWQVQSPSRAGMDKEGLDSAMDYAFRSGRNTQGVVIVRHGVIVAERYASEEDEQSLATSWSTGKSIASAIIGIAVDEGLISSIDDPAAHYLPEWKDTGREAVTIRALLEMRSGLVRQEGSETNNIYANGGNQLAFSLDRIIGEAPRTRWVYRNEDSMLLAGIIENATGMSVGEYAEEHLFSKIGMKALWWTDTAGHALTYCCVDATSRDFARFGLLFARGGKWMDEQIVSESWVEESTTVPEGNNYYALQWWVFSEWGAIVAIGLHTNNIWVYPDIDLVVVRNSFYTRIGSRLVRTEDNYHYTKPPETWDSNRFLGYILGAVSD